MPSYCELTHSMFSYHYISVTVSAEVTLKGHLYKHGNLFYFPLTLAAEILGTSPMNIEEWANARDTIYFIPGTSPRLARQLKVKELALGQDCVSERFLWDCFEAMPYRLPLWLSAERANMKMALLTYIYKLG